MTAKRVYLSESEMPSAWYNLMADLPEPLPPPLNPATGQPVGPADLEPIFPQAIIAQEMSPERWIEIPEAVRHVYSHLAAHAAGPCPQSGTRAEDPGADLLQGRKPKSARQS